MPTTLFKSFFFQLYHVEHLTLRINYELILISFSLHFTKRTEYYNSHFKCILFNKIKIL